MPAHTVVEGKDSKGPFFHSGHQGRKFYYSEDDDRSKASAKRRALAGLKRNS